MAGEGFWSGVFCGAASLFAFLCFTVAIWADCVWRREESQREAARRRLGTLDGKTGLAPKPRRIGGVYLTQPGGTPAIVGSEVISDPGAALHVELLHLSDEANAKLTTNVDRIPGVDRQTR